MKSASATPATVVAILLNRDTLSVEYVPTAPLTYTNETLDALIPKWAARKLRFVGYMSWCDGNIQTTLEPMPGEILARLHMGFQAYLACAVGGR